NNDSVEFLELSRSIGDRIRFSIDSVSRNRIRPRLQTRIDHEIRKAGFSRSGSTPPTNWRANRDRSFLRFSRDARRKDSCGGKKSRSLASQRAERTSPKGNFGALQIFARSLDPFRVNDRLRRRLAGMALSPHQAGRAHHRRKAWHRRLTGCPVLKRIALQT